MVTLGLPGRVRVRPSLPHRQPGRPPGRGRGPPGSNRLRRAVREGSRWRSLAGTRSTARSGVAAWVRSGSAPTRCSGGAWRSSGSASPRAPAPGPRARRARGAAGGPAQPPARRRGLRPRARTTTALAGDGVRRGRQPRRAGPARRAAVARRGRSAAASGGRRAGRRPRGGHRAPRREAVEHPGHRRRPGEALRLRDRPRRGGRVADPDRPGDRLAGVPRPRDRLGPDGHDGRRRLVAGRHRLPRAGRPAAVRGRRQRDGRALPDRAREPPRLPDAGWLTTMLDHTMVRDPGSRWTMAHVRDFLDGGPLLAGSTAALADQERTTVAGPAPVAAYDGSPAPHETQVLAPTPPTEQGFDEPPAHRRGPSGVIITVLVALATALLFLLFAYLFGAFDQTDGSTAQSSPPRSPSSSTSSSPAAPTSQTTDAQAQAAAMEGFVSDYLTAAVDDPKTSWTMLYTGVPGRQRGLRAVQEVLGPVGVRRRRERLGRPGGGHRELHGAVHPRSRRQRGSGRGRGGHRHRRRHPAPGAPR